MKFFIVGLGNPGDAYTHTRHNVGRMVLDVYAEKHNAYAWQYDKYADALITHSVHDKGEYVLVKPETYMNKSGYSVKKLVSTEADAGERIVVVYDDSDLPLGSFKIAYGRGSGGHKGVESIINALGTKDFVRVRIGVTPVTLAGKMKKALDHKNWILKKFTNREQDILEGVIESACDALNTITTDGLQPAMNVYN